MTEIPEDRLVGKIPQVELDEPVATEDLTLHPGSLVFFTGKREFIRAELDGSVFIRGEKVDSNVTIYEALQAWIAQWSPPRRPIIGRAIRHPACWGAVLDWSATALAGRG